MSGAIARLERVNDMVGRAVRWLALAMVLLQFAIVLFRHLFGVSFIFLQEGVLYMHAALFMLGAGYVFLMDDHVRVDILYARMSVRGQTLVDLFGGLFLMLPGVLSTLYVTWPFVRNSWTILEGPISVGGIPASFLLKTLIPVFCLLLLIQGVANILKASLRLAGAGEKAL